MNTISQLKAEIAKLQKTIDTFELYASDFIDAYDEMLDDCYGSFMGMYASRILEECDPIAYSCGLSDYVDGMDIEDSEEYQDYVSQLEELESELEDLENELEDLENE